ncbi:tRNA ligase class II core domain protein [Ancylostoma duodenale]|uniref:tRNA ligase class II core domain protein n=1 Tax=Ancylostoma duodenale TaxID=51022 RepID=A0A0C2HAT0_9BILA|nr:tRNA ligase class II core domain protein [Ancylostoma duodenale]
MHSDDSPPDPDHDELETSMYVTGEEFYGLPYLDRKQLTEWRQSQAREFISPFKRTHAERNLKLHRDEGFLFFESGGGSPYWWPKNTRVYNVLVELIVSEYSRRGFCEAVTPNMYADSLWEPDGRWKLYLDEISRLVRFLRLIPNPITECVSRLEEQRDEMLTASCSGHCLLYGHQTPLYSELPIKHADFGVLHRSDGASCPLPLPYIYRFSEDDSHVFCRPDQIVQEIKVPQKATHTV